MLSVMMMKEMLEIVVQLEATEGVLPGVLQVHSIMVADQVLIMAAVDQVLTMDALAALSMIDMMVQRMTDDIVQYMTGDTVLMTESAADHLPGGQVLEVSEVWGWFISRHSGQYVV